MKSILTKGINNTLAICDILLGNYESAAQRFILSVSAVNVVARPDEVMLRVGGQLKNIKINNAEDVLQSIKLFVFKRRTEK
jgi:hypothetical protein